ncbi:hypothetical Protein YC6258_05142 [Gynuella sunshinyii YC6258]|uniref:Uncharacterized protein n=1 Tax=Gynuella sunshinyii YC6258 TaxID=1445510 RepID=A0A0C5VSH5_9GAMM|nr:hypothetical Protein YC6258_05142 [Gynuella sunshinyii YC6258]
MMLRGVLGRNGIVCMQSRLHWISISLCLVSILTDNLLRL